MHEEHGCCPKVVSVISLSDHAAIVNRLNEEIFTLKSQLQELKDENIDLNEDLDMKDEEILDQDTRLETCSILETVTLNSQKRLVDALLREGLDNEDILEILRG